MAVPGQERKESGLAGYLGPFDPVIFWVTAVITLFAVVYGFVAPESFDGGLSSVQSWITARFSWFFILSVAIYFIVIMVIAFGKYGSLKLGKAEDKPEFSYFSWIAMLFSCGVGVGYAFWAVGEPIMHYMKHPLSCRIPDPCGQDCCHSDRSHALGPPCLGYFLPWWALPLLFPPIAWANP